MHNIKFIRWKLFICSQAECLLTEHNALPSFKDNNWKCVKNHKCACILYESVAISFLTFNYSTFTCNRPVQLHIRKTAKLHKKVIASIGVERAGVERAGGGF